MFHVTMTAGEMIEMVNAAGLYALPIFVDGTDEIAGYTLCGPRRMRKTVGRSPDGTYDLFSVKLFLDGVAYANAKREELAR